MTFFSLLYIIASVASIAAGLPQIIQILKTKNVEGISMQTYTMWFVLQAICLPYNFQSGDMMWFAICILWTAYYIVMIVLIKYYKYPRYIRSLVDTFVRIVRLVPVRVK